jgi:PAS domain S-box-containing protein
MKAHSTMSQAEKLNILLVDDQPGKLLSYEVILKDLGENLIMAQSGAEALEHLLKKEVAVLLVDVCMPELDGFELAAMIRDHPRCEKTAIIFISAVQLTDVDRIRGYEMGAVDYVPVPVVPQVLRAKVKVFTELFRKTRQLEQLNRELEARVAERTAQLESYASRLSESERRRSLALAASEMGSWDWDLTRGDCMWDEGQCRIFGVNHATFRVTPERVKALLEPEGWDRLKQVLADAASTRAHEAEFRVRRPNGELRWCLGTAAATVDSQGRVTRISGVTMDITDRKRAEERQAFLAREVDHRARNVLAVVQSMLRLTKADTTEAYVAAVEGRINALSRAHMLLSECRWEGADLRRLVDEELDPYRNLDASAVVAEGPGLLLDSRRAQTVALVLHELATNAAKHGALVLSSGRIKLSWRQQGSFLVLEWSESGGPKVYIPSSRGYGMRVISASIEQLGGEVKFDWQVEGLRCVLSLPLAEKAKRLDGEVAQQQAADRPTRISLVENNSRVLLVEDESLVAMMMVEALVELGLTVIGPYANTAEATQAVNETPVGAAILDINLGREMVYPVAEVLEARGIPFAFVTGYGSEGVDRRYSAVPLLLKPVDKSVLQNLFIANKSAHQNPANDVSEMASPLDAPFGRAANSDNRSKSV